MTGSIVKVIGPILDDDGQPTGRYEVQQWIDREGRYTWATADARADELAPAPDAPAAALTRDDPTYAVFEWTGDGPRPSSHDEPQGTN